MYFKKLSEISKDDVGEVGGKGACLGEMFNVGIPVPPGFVVTSETYRQFVNSHIPIEVEREILKVFDDLGVIRVAVRSSAIAEDSKTASWAGQLESYLNVTRNKLIESIRECWNSIKSQRALAYTAMQNLPEDHLVVAVVVQKMVDSEVSGVMFTTNPITHNESEIMIEAGFGLGEMIVQGMITPDNYIYNKKLKEVTNFDIQVQETMMVFKDGENLEVPVPEDKKNEASLSDEEVKRLAELGIKIETHYGMPMDIEWAMEKGEIYIVQVRPITA